MTIETEPATAPVVPEPKPNGFQRIVGVLTAPTSTFERIAARPDVLVPLLVVLLFSIVTNVMLAQHIDFGAITRQAIEDSQRPGQQMTAEQMDRAVRFGGAIAKAMTYAGPVISLIVLAVIAGLMLIGFRMFGGEGDFKQAFSITVYSWFPMILFGIVSLVVLMSRKSVSAMDLRNPVMSNLGFLADPMKKPFAFAILSSIDVFSIWTMVLMVIGFTFMSRMSRGKTAAVVVTYWVLYIGIFKMIGAAFQAMRAKS